MLARLDRILAPLTWGLAAILVLMLFIGPKIVADDKAKPAGGEAAGAAPYSSAGGRPATADGRKLFSDRCGGCHTLSAAGTSGAVGPKLDGAALKAATVALTVREGRGAMPAFGDDLSEAEIAAVADFVARASGG